MDKDRIFKPASLAAVGSEFNSAVFARAFGVSSSNSAVPNFRGNESFTPERRWPHECRMPQSATTCPTAASDSPESAAKLPQAACGGKIPLLVSAADDTLGALGWRGLIFA